MMDIKSMLSAVYSHMDSNGMFPASSCARCGKELNKGGMHPAELYAGTFNGLCYPCTSAGPFVTEVSTLDGAYLVSYPPHAPSWRRNRETFRAYPDCLTCRGAGVDVSRPRGANNVRYSCRECADRFYQHSLRKWALARDDQLHRAAQNRYDRWLVAQAKAALKTRGEKALKKAVEAEKLVVHKKPMAEYVRGVLTRALNEPKARLARMIEVRGVWETRPPTEEEEACENSAAYVGRT